MGPTALDQIAAMLQSCGSNQEIKISRGAAILRINLRLDDLNLWGESAEVLPSANIILACDNDTAEIEESKLTWVVGAAIRGVNLDIPDQAIALLIKLGIEENIAAEIINVCPGLCKEVTWAFYRERHGWLCASPALNREQINKVYGGGNGST
jgi:hypothetical protein